MQHAAASDIDDGGSRTVHLAPENVVIATPNIGAAHLRTDCLDPSLVNRMLIIRTSFSRGREGTPAVRRGVGERGAVQTMNAARAVRKEPKNARSGRR